MRKIFLIIFFIILLMLCILFLFEFFQSKHNMHVDENISLSKPTITRSISTTSHGRAADSEVKDRVDHAYAYHSYSYSTEPTSLAVSDSEPMAPAPAEAPAASTEPAAGSESALKYVLFSVTYDAQIIAGETESLQLRMSPRNELAQLEKAINEKKLQQSQIKEIAKVKNKYRYVSAHLVAQDNCLTIKKMMPEEDKVYLPNVNESSSDQIWQWDMTAPDAPKGSMCHLSLFIRFCLNQNDCLPMENPDKEFSINVEVTVGHKIYKWFTGLGEIAGTLIPIISLLGLLGVWQLFNWLKRKKARKKSNSK